MKKLFSFLVILFYITGNTWGQIKPTISSIKGSETSCYDVADGTVSGTIFPGTDKYAPPYDIYLLKNDNPIPVATISNTSELTFKFENLGYVTYLGYGVRILKAGEYMTGQVKTTVTRPPELDIVNIVPMPEFCGELGSIRGQVTGGKAGYTVTVSGTKVDGTSYSEAKSTPSGQFVFDVPAGTYSLSAVDQGPCSILKPNTYTIDPSSKVEAQEVQTEHKNVSCRDGDDGSFEVEVVNPIPNMTYYFFLNGVYWGESPDFMIFSGRSEGDYEVTITLDYVCYTMVPVTITEPPTALKISSISSTDVTCNNLNDGKITVTGIDGVAFSGNEYMYHIVGGTVDQQSQSVSATFSPLPDNTYTVSVTDARGCTVSESRKINNPDPITFTPDPVSPKCNNDATGSITIKNLAGGTVGSTGFTFSLTGTDTNGQTVNRGPQTTLDFTGLKAGTYAITVKDGNGCTPVTSPVSVALVNPPLLTVNNSDKSSTPVSCTGDANSVKNTDGTITVKATGGTPDAGKYKYECNGQTITDVSATFTGLAAGTYTVTITDANGCSTTTDVKVDAPAQLKASIIQHTDVSCNGNSDGALKIQATGGTPNYSYSWTKDGSAYGANADNITGTKGSYTVTVTDDNGCTATATDNITEPDAMDVTFINQVNVACYGTATGEVTAVPSGGTGPYTYFWSPVPGDVGTQTQATAKGLKAQTYTVTVTDSKGCTPTTAKTVTIVELQTPIAVTATSGKSPLYCVDEKTTITVTDPVGSGYVYKLAGISTGWQTSNIFSDLGPGDYTVYVQYADATTCPESSYFSEIVKIKGQPENIDFKVTPTLNQCAGDQLGQIKVDNIQDGISPYNFYLQQNNTDVKLPVTAATEATFTQLFGGLYIVIVEDANGCKKEKSVNLIDPQSIVLGTPTSVPVTCRGVSDGKVYISATGGTSLVYSISPNPVGSTQSPSGSGVVFAGLPAGTYAITVTENGASCSESVNNVVVSEPEAIIFGAPISIELGCKGDTTHFAVPVTNPAANLLEYSIDGGATWQDSRVFKEVYAGTYTIRARYKATGNSCTYFETYNVTITEPTDKLELAEGTVESPLCHNYSDGKATVIASKGWGNYTYLWKTNPVQTNATAINLTGGSYWAYVTDKNGAGCKDSIQIYVQPVSPVTATVTATDVTCASATDGTIAASNYAGGTVTNVSDYYYTVNGNPPQSTYGAGTYTVVAYDKNNCPSQDYVVNIAGKIKIDFKLDSTAVSCYGLSNGEIFIKNISGGSGQYLYRLDASVPAALPATGTTISGLIAKMYTVDVLDANVSGGTCFVSKTIELTQPGELTMKNIPAISLTCADETTTITVLYDKKDPKLAVEYTINGVDWYVSPIFTVGKGNYTAGVRYADPDHRCPVTQPVTVTAPDAITFDVTPTVPVTMDCNGTPETITISNVTGGNGGYQYSFDGGTTWGISPVKNDATPGTYYICVKDNKDCKVCHPDPVIIQVASPTITVSGVAAKTQLDCYGDLTQITVTATGTETGKILQVSIDGIHWQQGGNYTFPDIPAGDHYVYASYQGEESCMITSNMITISQPDAILVKLKSQTPASGCAGQAQVPGSATIEVTGGSPTYQYQLDNGAWTALDASGLISGLSDGPHSINVKDSKGCQVAAALPVTIDNTTASQIVVTLVAAVSPTCYNGTDGSATVLATGGNVVSSSDYTYVWYDSNNMDIGKSTAAVTGLKADLYTVVVSDLDGCKGTLQVTVSAIQPITADVTSTPISCNGAKDGQIVVSNIVGGNGGYVIRINGTIVTSPYTVTQAGDYDVVISDSKSCTSQTYAVHISEPAAITFDVTHTDATCFDTNDATAEVINVAGGNVNNYVYEWEDVMRHIIYTGQSVTDLGAGFFRVKVSEVSTATCFTTKIFEVKWPGELEIGSINGETSLTCANDKTTLSITLSKKDPLLVVQYTIDGVNWQENPVFNNVAVGDYFISARYKDGSRCATTPIPVSVTAPAPITFTVTTNPDPPVLDCDGSTARIMVSGVTGGTVGSPADYRYSFDGGQTWQADSYKDVLSGTYTVCVMDKAGCVFCNNQAIVIDANSDVTIVSASAATNMLDCGGDHTTISVIATGNDPAKTLQVSLDQVTWIVVADGVSFTFPDQITVGTWYVYARYLEDPTCVEISNPIDVVQPDAISILLGAITPSSGCAGQNPTLGSVEITVSGGSGIYEYDIDNMDVWTPMTGNTVIIPLGQGYHAIQIRDNKECTSDPAIVNIPNSTPTVTVAIIGLTHPECHEGTNGSAEVDASNGTAPYTYSWYNSAAPTVKIGDGPTISGLSGGIYIAQAVDANGCIGTVDVPITPVAAITASITTTDITCSNTQDGTITVGIPQGGNTGAYGLTVTLGGTVIQPTSAPGVFPASYTGLDAGDYTIVVTDSKNCTSTYTKTIHKPLPITFDIASQNVSCFGESDGWVEVINQAGGPHPGSYIYTWQNDANQNVGSSARVNNLPIGTYTVVVSDISNAACFATKTKTLTQPGLLAIDKVDGNTALTCASDKAHLTIVLSDKDATLDVEYSMDGLTWQPGHTFDLNARPAPYTPQVRYIDIVPTCVVTGQNITVTAPDPIDYQVVVAGSPIDCNDPLSTASINITNLSGGSGSYEYSFDGGTNWGNNATLTTNQSGIYYVCVRDANATDCKVCDATPYIISGDADIVVTAYPDPATLKCADDKGNIVVTVTEGTPTNNDIEVTYDGKTWIPIDKVQGLTFNNVPAGTYYVLAQYVGTLCAAVSNEVTIVAPAPVVATFDSKVDATGCVNEVPGSAEISATGGNGVYKYQVDGSGPWVDFTTNPMTVPNLYEGTYSIAVEDGNGCKATPLSVTIDNPDKVKILHLENDIQCFGEQNGEITVRASNGQAPYAVLVRGIVTGTFYTHTLADETDSYTFTGLWADTYSIQVTDQVGCQQQTLAQIQSPSEPLIAKITPKDICPGETKGGYVNDIHGGWPGYDYYWYYNSSQPADVDDYTTLYPLINGQPQDKSPAPDKSLDQGYYKVIVIDNSGCSDTAFFQVVIMPTNPKIDKATPYGVRCHQPNTGSIKVKISGGLNGPYLLRLRDANGKLIPGYDYKVWANDSITGLNAGMYIVDALDSHAPTCDPDTQGPIEIKDDAGLSIDKISLKEGKCHGDLSAITDIRVSGSSRPLEYMLTWSGGQTQWQRDPAFNNLTDDIYTIDVREANMTDPCTATKDTIISAPAAILIADYQVIEPTCDAPQGSVTILVRGGKGKLSLTFNNEDVPGTLVNNTINMWSFTKTVNKGGKANIYVIDENGCDYHGSIDVPYTPGLDYIRFDKVDNVCPDDVKGALTVLVASIDPSRTPVSLTYELYNGDVTDKTKLRQSLTQDIITDPAVFNNLPGGTYTISVHDPTPCYSKDSTFIVDYTNKVEIEDVQIFENMCTGRTEGEIDFTIVGKDTNKQYEYSLDGGTTKHTVPAINGSAFVPIANLAGDSTYTVTIYYGECKISQDFYVPNLFEVKPTVTVDNYTGCTGAFTIKMPDKNGVPYEYWYSDLAAGVYKPFVPVTNDQAKIDNLTGGDYKIVVKDRNRCLSDTIRQTIGQRMEVSYKIIDPIACKGNYGKVEITISKGKAPYTVSVVDKPDYAVMPTVSGSGDTFTLSNMTGGLYKISVEDADGCQDILDLNIEVPKVVIIDASYTDISCTTSANQTTQLTVKVTKPASGTFIYSLDNEYPTPPPTTDLTKQWNVRSGAHYVSVTDQASNCVADTTIIVVVPDPIAIDTTMVLVSHGKCVFTADVTLHITGGTAPYTVYYNGASITDYTLIGLTSDFTVKVVDKNNCETERKFTLSLPKGIIVDADIHDVVCNKDGKGSITIFPATYTYLWEDGSTKNSRHELDAGDYKVNISTTGCAIDTMFTVKAANTVEAKLEVLGGIDPSSICPGVNFEVKGSYTTGPTSNDPNASALWLIPGVAPETYDAATPVKTIGAITGKVQLAAQLYVESAKVYCRDTATVMVTTYPVPTINMAVDTIYIPKDEIYLLVTDVTGDYQPGSVIWTAKPDYGYHDYGHNISPVEISAPDDGRAYTLKLTITNEVGCKVSDSVYVSRALDFFIPNAFTPNDDGYHDTWKFRNIEQYIDYYEIQVAVFNRGGFQVYEGKGYNNSSVVWDGRRNGNDLPIGTYYYVVKLVPRSSAGSSTTLTFKGSVTIIR